VSAQLWNEPPAIAITSLEAETSTGAERLTFVPSPSWP
jgi:hypothetical protein